MPATDLEASPRLRLAGSDRALFASDMHLGVHDPATTAFFMQSLEAACTDPATRPTHLFLLGDLFEVWVGDDDPLPAGQSLARLLRFFGKSGIACHVMRGNRDFLLGEPLPGRATWLQTAGAHLLDEPWVLDLFGTATVLCHGDSLCTDDLPYQQFRRLVRSPAWQAEFLGKPLTERQAIANGIRNQSEKGKGEKPAPWMDASEAAIRALFMSSGTRQMIHGHTHRPGVHVYPAVPAGDPPDRADPGQAAGDSSATAKTWAMRHVLPDWQAPQGAGGLPARGHFLLGDAAGLRVLTPPSC